MAIFNVLKLGALRKTNDTDEVDWDNYSDNYVSATAPNGYTVLASKSASFVSVRKKKKNKTNDESTKRK